MYVYLFVDRFVCLFVYLPWKLVILEPCDATYVLCDIGLDDSDWGMGSGSNNLTFDLEVGDTFVVRAKARNVKGVLSTF
jgi:hypothetical protein